MFLDQPNQKLHQELAKLLIAAKLVMDVPEREVWEKSQYSSAVTHPIEDQSHVAFCHFYSCCYRAAGQSPRRSSQEFSAKPVMDAPERSDLKMFQFSSAVTHPVEASLNVPSITG